MEKISDKKISKFKKIGYLETLPENANLNEYEKISILIKQKKILYLNIKLKKVYWVKKLYIRK